MLKSRDITDKYSILMWKDTDCESCKSVILMPNTLLRVAWKPLSVWATILVFCCCSCFLVLFLAVAMAAALETGIVMVCLGRAQEASKFETLFLLVEQFADS